MSTIRSRITILTAIAVSLVSGAAVGVTAQDVDEASADPMAPAYFTGSLSFDGYNTAPGTETVEGGVTRSRGQAWSGLTFQTSDPRLSGELTVSMNGDWYALPDGQRTGISWGTYRIENAEGAWEGPFSGTEYPDERSPDIVWLVGEGAYEGLTAFVHEVSGPIEGVIVPGPLPGAE